jgi:hypothetical protein
VIAAQHREFRSGIQQAWPRASVDRLRDLGVVHRKALRRTLTAGPSTTFDDLLTMYAVMSAEEWARERGRVPNLVEKEKWRNLLLTQTDRR